MSNGNPQNFFMNPAVANFMPQLQNPMATPFPSFPCQQNPLLNPSLKFPPFFQPNIPGYGDFPPNFRGLYGNPLRKMTSQDHHDDGEADDAKAEVENGELWQKFSNMNTEMVITKTGRFEKNIIRKKKLLELKLCLYSNLF